MLGWWPHFLAVALEIQYETGTCLLLQGYGQPQEGRHSGVFQLAWHWYRPSELTAQAGGFPVHHPSAGGEALCVPVPSVGKSRLCSVRMSGRRSNKFCCLVYEWKEEGAKDDKNLVILCTAISKENFI